MLVKRSFKVLCVTAFLFSFLLVGNRRVNAFEPYSYNWSYMSNPTVTFNICPEGMPPGMEELIKESAAAWDYPGFRFEFGEDMCRDERGRNGVNEVKFEYIEEGYLGVARYSIREGNLKECDVSIGNQHDWYVGTDALPDGKRDFMRTAIHEFGHCVGLGHEEGVHYRRSRDYPFYPLSPIMAVNNTRIQQGSPRELTPDDRAGRNYIYGGPSGLEMNMVTLWESHNGEFLMTNPLRVLLADTNPKQEGGYVFRDCVFTDKPVPPPAFGANTCRWTTFVDKGDNLLLVKLVWRTGVEGKPAEVGGQFFLFNEFGLGNWAQFSSTAFDRSPVVTGKASGVFTYLGDSYMFPTYFPTYTEEEHNLDLYEEEHNLDLYIACPVDTAKN